MTTIAFDGTTLAGDRQCTAGGTPFPTRKIHRVIRPTTKEVLLYGFSGLAGDGAEFVRRFASGEALPQFTDLEVLCIDGQGQAWQMDTPGMWWNKRPRVWAIGSGADYAMGAMYAGKTAREAVQIAMRLDVHTGFGVDTVRF